MPRTLTRLALSLLIAAGAAGLVALRAQDADAASVEELQWPRVVEAGDTTFTIYQPQIDKFEDAMLEARAAVKVDTKVGDKTQTSYGVVWISARTQIDKENALVELDDIQITKANFPTAPEKTEEYLETFRQYAEPTRTISLERIEANLAITQADRRGNAVPLKNDPPTIYYRETPALLVLIDGDPALRPVEGVSGLQRVVNTKSLILEAGGTYYMSLADRWLQAGAATGPWQILGGSPPAPVTGVRDAIAKDENQTQVDLLEDPGEEVKAVLSEGKAPEIIVSTGPAELIVTSGKPQMKPIAGTQLLYVENTTGDIFLDLKDQSYYVTLTGRWFRSKSLEKGPWQFVEGDKLPKDFAKIPENDPKASVLATVPGTPAAQEANIANSIPQTAEVNREEATYEAKYDGEPKFDDVPDTPIQYAVNSPTPVVRVSPTSYYSVQGGVWFTGGSPYGPWAVATVVPPVIYTIPTASPIHYVTYVRVYRYSPTTVWFGYTPGYMGTCYSPWGTVVYGTGWYYRPWIGNSWYGAPWTFGFGVGMSWSPWTGWDVGFGWGGYYPIYRPWWGPYYGWRPRPPRPGPYPPHYRPGYGRPMPYRPASINITNVNVYNRPGIARPGVRPVAPPARPAPGRPVPGSARAAARHTTRPVAALDAAEPTRNRAGARTAGAAFDATRAVKTGQRLRRPGRKRVSPAARTARKLGDQRPGNLEAGSAFAPRDAPGAAVAALDAAGSALAALDPARPAVDASGGAELADRRPANDQPALPRPAGPPRGRHTDEPAAAAEAAVHVETAGGAARPRALVAPGASAEEAVGGTP